MVVAMELKTVLAKVASQMGYTELQPKQEEVILDSVCGSDVFISLPAGSGKFVCYSLLGGAPPAKLIHRNRSEPSHSTNERSGEGQDGKERPRGLR